MKSITLTVNGRIQSEEFNTVDEVRRRLRHVGLPVRGYKLLRANCTSEPMIVQGMQGVIEINLGLTWGEVIDQDIELQECLGRDGFVSSFPR